MINQVMRDTENYIYFWNVTFKVKRNPNYTGNHYLADVNHVLGNTFPLETTREEMIEQFNEQEVNMTHKHKDMIEVVEITKCFEDRSPKGRFHKDNY